MLADATAPSVSEIRAATHSIRDREGARRNMTTEMRIRALICAAVTIVAAVATAFVQEYMTGGSSAAVIGAVAGVAFVVSFYFLVMRFRQQT